MSVLICEASPPPRGGGLRAPHMRRSVSGDRVKGPLLIAVDLEYSKWQRLTVSGIRTRRSVIHFVTEPATAAGIAAPPVPLPSARDDDKFTLDRAPHSIREVPVPSSPAGVPLDFDAAA